MGKNKLDGFTEVKQDVFKFENKGDSIQGKLLEKKESEEFNNQEYKIKSSDGIEHIIFGHVMLDSKMENVDVGSIVNIELIGETPPKKEGHNPTKQFVVHWKKDE